MPLVDPVTTSMSKKDDNSNNDELKALENDGPTTQQKDEWATKLMGKTCKREDHSEVNYNRTELPKESRVIAPGQAVTKDYMPNRMNVHVDENETVMNITYG
jgi:hypothetical protein